MRTAALSLLCALALVACGNSTGGAASTSGVDGTVTMGPTCPVERIGTPCEKVWTGTVDATDLDGNVVASVETDGSGRFRLGLDPGGYIISADTAGGSMPRGIPVEVSVKSGTFTHVKLQVDTGIR